MLKLKSEIVADLLEAGLSERWVPRIEQLLNEGKFETVSSLPPAQEDYENSSVSWRWETRGKIAMFANGESGNESLQELLVQE